MVVFYGVLLRLLPAWFRARYAEEMRAMFARQWAEARGWQRVRIGVRALRDVTATALHVRLFPGEYPAMLRSGSSGSPFAGLMFDARLAMRSLRRRPAFAATAIGTIALGIGATTAVFSVVDATVLRALRYPESGRVISLWSTFTDQGGSDFQLSPAEFTDLRTDLRSVELLGGYGGSSSTLEPTDGSVARTIDLAFTVGDIYEILGARVVAGRLPGPADDQLGSPAVALLTHGLWTESFGADPGVVGTRTIRLGTQEATIIGVLAPDATLPDTDADVWTHWVLDPASWASNRSGHSVEAVARLRPGATLETVRAELTSLQRTWAERYAGQHSIGLQGHGIQVEQLGDRLLGSTRRVAWLLSAAAGLLLVLACANVANLLLARGETRSSEIGVRIALGASPRRVARPVLVEGVVLGVAGGMAGLLVTMAGLPLLLSIAPQGMANLDAVRMDVRVALFGLIVSLCTGLFFALAPALSAARRDPAQLLRASGRGRTAGSRGLRMLVVGQTALATVLLAMAGLLTRSLLEVTSIDPGFESQSRVALDLTLPADRYADAEAIVAFYESVRERVNGLPGVESAAIIRSLPLRDFLRRERVLREGDVSEEDRVGIVVQTATPGMLAALGVPLVEGRDLQAGDRSDGDHVAMVNVAAARILWPGESAVGKRLRPLFAPPEWGLATIVGVYEDVRGGGVLEEPAPQITLPLAQMPGWIGFIRTGTLVVHGTSGEESMINAARTVIHQIDPAVPAEEPTTLDAVVRASTARERFIAALLQTFAVLALAIAGVGVFGVVSFTVARQGRELAIRNALGAGGRELLLRVLRGTFVMAGLGALAGTAIVLLAAPGLAGFLHGVAPRDAFVLVSVPAALIFIALLSSLAPALRASRVSPSLVLQEGD